MCERLIVSVAMIILTCEKAAAEAIRDKQRATFIVADFKVLLLYERSSWRRTEWYVLDWGACDLQPSTFS